MRLTGPPNQICCLETPAPHGGGFRALSDRPQLVDGRRQAMFAQADFSHGRPDPFDARNTRELFRTCPKYRLQAG